MKWAVRFSSMPIADSCEPPRSCDRTGARQAQYRRCTQAHSALRCRSVNVAVAAVLHVRRRGSTASPFLRHRRSRTTRLHPFRIEANLCAFLRTLSDTDGDESLTGFNGLAITSGQAIGKEEDRIDFPATFHRIASTVKSLVVRPDALVCSAPPLPAHRPCSSLLRGGFHVEFPRDSRNVPTRNRSTAHYHACLRPIRPQRRRRAQLSASAALSSSSASQASAQHSLVECCTRHQDDSLNDEIIVLRRVLTERCSAPAPRPTLAAHSPA